MKKILSKALSVVVFITMILPSTGTVFAETVGQVTGTIITAKNNAGMPDTLTVTGLVVGDIVKVYSIVQSSSSITKDGKIVKTIQTPKEMQEQVKLSTPPLTSIDVNGTVTVTEIIVTEIGNAIAKADKATKGAKSAIPTASAIVSTEFPVMGGLFEKPLGGCIYVTVKRKGLLESIAQKVTYDPEQRTDPIGNVTVENNAGMPDTVTVAGLEVGDIVKVYSESISGEQVATQTTTKTQTYIFLVTIREQLTNAIKEAQAKCDYAERCEVEGKNEYQLEARKKFQEAINVANNNPNGELVKQADIAVNKATKASAKVKADAAQVAAQAAKVAAQAALDAAIQAAWDAATPGTYKVQVARDTSEAANIAADLAIKESNLATVAAQVALSPYYENLSNTPTKTVADLDTAATVAVEKASPVLSNLAEATTIFEGAFLKAPIGTATAKVDKATKTATATISIPQLYEDEGNKANTNRKIYVTVTKKTKLESYKIGPKDYGAEKVTDMPSSIVTVVNNALELDTITVKDLKLGDVVTIYEESKKGAVPIGTAIAKADKLAKGAKLAKDAIPTATATLSITLPKPEGGSIYISVTTKAKRESEKSKAVPYGAEGQTNPPSLQLQ
ncbi:hypothetical protein [Clostridium tagluense]|uniref:Uncharacterized protein n=1 Tax=Clostridium tagluense TaxID=360422 RepID=A0A401URB7_9CLOT|nr:hypothetical protein [Clostridium tagluense]GCD12103.1 hypothetical protein Ctaglu_37260 [Clostridium tagluense]